MMTNTNSSIVNSTSVEDINAPCMSPDDFLFCDSAWEGLGWGFDDEWYGGENNDSNYDCSELDQLLKPSTQSWHDFLPGDGIGKTKITMDEAKYMQWERAKKEILHVKHRLTKMLLDFHDNASSGDVHSPTLPGIVDLCIGCDSAIGHFFKRELDLNDEEYMEFMMTICIQAAYKVSTTQLFDDDSKLKHSVPMTKNKYTSIWKKLATKKSISPYQMTNGRRESFLWEKFESILNNLLREISIVDREGKIGIALDDDKIWLNASKNNLLDTFGLKYTTHTKPNRKGLVAHTAVSSGANMPLGVAFERTKDTTLQCFKRILTHLFCRNGDIDLSSVEVYSDRGYMLPDLVFEFLVKFGAEVVGTVKRIAQCWPFTYNQKLRQCDKRTLIDCKGAPTLFLKWARICKKKIWALAFRNGSESVATAISTIHKGHHWEGIVVKYDELFQYKLDPSALRSCFFERVLDHIFGKVNKDEITVLNDILDNKIEPLTIRQGKDVDLFIFLIIYIDTAFDDIFYFIL